MFHDEPIDEARRPAGPASHDDDDSAKRATSDPDDAHAREIAELNDRLLRTAAEFDNYRKRTDREKREWSDAAAMDVIRDFLPALDDLDRALAASEKGADGGALRKGVELIRQKLTQTLEKRGLRAIPTVGAMFDPKLHEAIGHDVVPGKKDGEITVELQRGYTLGDRLVRAAMVKVAKA